MSTHLPGFQSFLSFFTYFVLAKLSTSSIRVKVKNPFNLLYSGDRKLRYSS